MPKPLPPTERVVQRQILRMAASCFPGVFIHHSPNGAHLAGEAGPLLGDGMRKGFPDLICLWAHGKGLLIECKRPRLGKVSDAQALCHAALTDIGWPVVVVTSPEEAFDALYDAGAPCRARIAA